ncbi:MAG: RCC1 domain-containing protein [Polyangiaceae bacterium]
MRLALAGLFALGCLVGCGDDGGSGAGGAGGAGGSGGSAGGGTGGSGGGELVTSFALGQDHVCAVGSQGSLKCWGQNASGQLGQGNTDTLGDDELPSSAPVVDVGGKVVQVAAGGAHTCVLLEAGDVKCFGSNQFGQLGYGMTNTIGDDELPSGIGNVDLGGKAKQVVAGRDFSCALLTDGTVRCWGAAGTWLGLGRLEAVGDDEVPTAVEPVNVGGSVVALNAAVFNVCARLDSGSLRCWGWANSSPYSGMEIGDDETPADAGDVDVGAKVTQASSSPAHTCVTTVEGHVRCWGQGNDFQLGYGGTDAVGDDESPATAGDVPLVDAVASVAAFRTGTCALTTAGEVKCWGKGPALGTGNANPVTTAASAIAIQLEGTPTAIGSSPFRVCSLLDSGLHCWGAGNGGALGYGSTDDVGDDETPASVGPVSVF